MDYTLEFEAEHRVVLVTLGKIVTGTSALAAYTAVEEFIAANGPHSGITNLSEVEKFYVKADFVWYLAGKPPMIPDGMARIVVAPRPDVFGISRMFQTLRDNQGTYLQVVRTLMEAFELLGLESPHFRPVDLAAAPGNP